MRKLSIFNALVITALLLNLTGCAGVQDIPKEIQSSPSYQVLSRIHADVLAIQVISAPDVSKVIPNITDIFAEDEKYVTEITLGFHTEDAADADLVDLSRISFCKRNGKPISGIAKNYYWRSNNGCYAIEILFVLGKLKASDISYTLQNVAGDITIQNALEDSLSDFNDYEKTGILENGQPAVFELNGRHYLNTMRYNVKLDFREEENGIMLCDTRRFVLIPLDGWGDSAPDNSCLKYDIRTEAPLPDNISVSASLSDEGKYSNNVEQNQDIQIYLNMTVETFLKTEVYKSDCFDEDIFRQINREVLKSSILTIEDRQGKIVKLSY